ncbi:MAG: TetR/AcrR family transcriptional regulator [Bacteroidales bacterium]|nr:TetR/AcrR family transcriptional regulator [Bacteroidales bacterium]
MMTKKQQQIFEVGKSLFWKHGTSRVSVEEICREAGVSKKTYYKYFSNKNELIRFILKHVTDEAILKYRSIMDSDMSFEEKVREQINQKLEGTKELSKEFLEDIYKKGDPEILAFIGETSQKTMKMVTDDYIEAQKQGDIRKDVSPKFMLYFMNQMMEMIKDERLVGMYESVNELIEEVINFFFYGVLSRHQ